MNFAHATSAFKIITLTGIFSQIPDAPETGINSSYSELGEYEFKIGIIVRQTGIFLIGANNLGSQGLRGRDCTNAGFNMTVTNANKHFNLFEYALGYPADALQRNNGYCFRVQ